MKVYLIVLQLEFVPAERNQVLSTGRNPSTSQFESLTTSSGWNLALRAGKSSAMLQERPFSYNEVE